MCGPGTPRDKVFIFIVIGALGDENDSEKCWGHLFKSAKCASGRIDPHGNMRRMLVFLKSQSCQAIFFMLTVERKKQGEFAKQSSV